MTLHDELQRILELAQGNPLALLELPTLVGAVDEASMHALRDPLRMSIVL